MVPFIAFPYSEKIKVSLRDHHTVCTCMSLCLCIPLIEILMAEPNFMKVGMYIMTFGPIRTLYFIRPSHQSVYMCIPLILLGNGTIRKLPW
jgi:hypothetical protein